MAPAFANVLRILPLALCLLAAGCAPREPLLDGLCRYPWLKGPTINLNETKTAQRPPEPGPALFIPGPAVAAKLASLPRDSAATPLPPLTPAIVKNKIAEEEPAKETPSPLRLLYDQAARRHEQMPCYAVRVRRREMVGGQAKPEEILAAKFRQEPYSVYFKWLGPEAKGREVIYVKGQHKNLIHTLTAAGDVWLFGAGKHFKIEPESAMVRAKSRYPITEAAVGSWIVKYGRMVNALDKNVPEAGTAKVLGALKRPEFDEKVVAVLHKIPPGYEAHLPRGGQRLWFFDPDHHLPVLIITHDDANREVEYYCLDQYQGTVPLTDADFDPEKLWKK